MAAVHGIVAGAPKLGVLNVVPTPASAALGTIYVNGTAGNSVATTDGSTVGQLTVFFSCTTCTTVVFSGAQFYLYLSKDGIATISPGDVKYAGPFLVSSIAANVGTLAASAQANGTYYVGTTSSIGGPCTPGCQVISGPLPLAITAGYKFIKVWDGSAVAGLQFLNIAPGIKLSPTSGPAGTPVTVKGGGFASGLAFLLNYTFPFKSFPAGATTHKKGHWQTGLNTGATGYFTLAAFPMLDTKQAINPFGGPFNDKIMITAVGGTKDNTLFANISPATPANFTEFSRIFTQANSFKSDGTHVGGTGAIGAYGNASASVAPGSVGPYVPAQAVDVYAFGFLIIAGNFSYYGGAVTVWISNGTSTGFNQVGSTTASSTSTSWYNITIVVPSNLPQGEHTVKVLSNNVAYTFRIDMNPTLVLTPSEGTASNPDTIVSVGAYGFPTNTLVLIYWNSTSWGDNLWYNFVNGTTGSNGQFNTSVTFTVPETFGGSHTVNALDFSLMDTLDELDTSGPCCPTLPNSLSGDSADMLDEVFEDGALIADATFTVLPSLVITVNGNVVTSLDNNGSLITAFGEGLIPENVYSVNIDNQQADFAVTFVQAAPGLIPVVTCTTITFHPGNSSNTHVTVNCTTTTITGSEGGSTGVHGLVRPALDGTLNLTFIAAGFRPGLHTISVNSNVENISAGSYGPDVYANWTVTTSGDPIAAMLTTMSAALTTIQSTLASITSSLSSLSASLSSLSSSVASLSTAVSALQTSVNNLQASVNTLSTSVAAVQASVSSISSSLSTLSGKVDSLSTSVGGLSTSLSDVSSKVTSISTAVGGLSGLGTQATNILNAVQTEQTYVLVVAALAAITLVLVLAVLIRKLS